MLAYNGSIPGPTLKVREGSEIAVNFINQGDLEGTIHWHGLRVENRFDGTHETQPPVEVGEGFTYRLRFPDPGVYWYHPHIRQDYGQELGLYGNIVVVPAEEGYWPSVNRELALTLDDVLLEDGLIAPFSPHETTHVAMGRFGNEFLVGGETGPRFDARAGEVVRLFLTNTANTRVFNVGLAGAQMKLVGGDSGRVEREELVDEVLLAPSERVVVDVLFSGSGEVVLEHRTPEQTYALATFTVAEERAEPQLEGGFRDLRTNPELVAERERIAPYPRRRARQDDRVGRRDEPRGARGPGRLPVPDAPRGRQRGGGQLPQVRDEAAPGRGADHVRLPHAPRGRERRAGHLPEVRDEARPRAARGRARGTRRRGARARRRRPRDGHGHGEGPAPIEWEDDMVEVNRMTTTANTRWTIVDRSTGAEGHAIDWTFRVGDRVKIRVENTLDSDHPMHHPFHIHGAGRFLILARDGVTEPNLVWKDTVLVRTGETLDLLLDVTNPGLWMAHCHIAEHHEGGMMFSFRVEEAA